MRRVNVVTEVDEGLPTSRIEDSPLIAMESFNYLTTNAVEQSYFVNGCKYRLCLSSCYPQIDKLYKYTTFPSVINTIHARQTSSLHPTFCGQYGIDIQDQNSYSSTMNKQDLIKHVLLNGTPVTIRPIRTDDSGMEQEFILHLSKESRYFRFMTSLRELSPKKLKYFTEIDYDQHMAFVATIMREDKELEIGVARYVHTEIPGSCEFGVTVDDAWHGSGVAGLLMISLEDTARKRGFKTMEGIVLPKNYKMLKFAQKRGFKIHYVPGEADTVHIALQL